MIVQLNNSGGFAVPEHKAEINEVLKSYAGKEIEIKISLVDKFPSVIEQSAALQERYQSIFRNESINYTIQEIAQLRGVIEACKMDILKLVSEATIEEKNKELRLQSIERTEKIFLIENGEKPALSSMKSKNTEAYKKAQEEYLYVFKIKEGLDAHCKALTGASNAIAGICKNGDDRYMKFGGK